MDGRTAVVTGGDTEPGASIVRALAEAGAGVVVGGRDADRLETLANGIEGSAVTTVRTDVRDEFDVERLVETAAREGGAVDAVVPAASVRHGPPGESPLQAESYAAMDDTLRTNLRGAFATVREAVPHLGADARIVVPVVRVEPAGDAVTPGTAQAGGGSYAVSQAATVALARGFAADLSQAVAAVDAGDAAPEAVAATVRWAAGAADVAAVDGRLLDPAERPSEA